MKVHIVLNTIMGCIWLTNSVEYQDFVLNNELFKKMAIECLVML